jgi:hypothetical protein
MQIGAYITEVIKLKENVEYADDPLTQFVRPHQHNTSSTLFNAATNVQKFLQSDTKQIKTTIARNLKERWEAKRLRGEFPWSLVEELIDKGQS